MTFEAQLASAVELVVVVCQGPQDPEARVACADFNDPPGLEEAHERVEERRGVLDAHVRRVQRVHSLEEARVEERRPRQEATLG